MQQGFAPTETCFNCGRPWGNGCACQFCNQMYGFPLGLTISSAGRRFGAHMIDFLVAVVTCGIGYLIWSLIIYGNGQTPGKQLMGMRVVNLVTGVRAGWGRMFVREFFVKALIGFFLGWLVLPYFWLLWDKNKQQLWDKMVETVVVDDPNGIVGNVPQPMSPYLQQPQQQYGLPPAGQPAPWEAQAGASDQQGGYGLPGRYDQPGTSGPQSGYPPPPPPSPNPPQQ